MIDICAFVIAEWLNLWESASGLLELWKVLLGSDYKRRRKVLADI